MLAACRLLEKPNVRAPFHVDWFRMMVLQVTEFAFPYVWTSGLVPTIYNEELPLFSGDTVSSDGLYTLQHRNLVGVWVHEQ